MSHNIKEKKKFPNWNVSSSKPDVSSVWLLRLWCCQVVLPWRCVVMNRSPVCTATHLRRSVNHGYCGGFQRFSCQPWIENCNPIPHTQSSFFFLNMWHVMWTKVPRLIRCYDRKASKKILTSIKYSLFVMSRKCPRLKPSARCPCKIIS